MSIGHMHKTPPGRDGAYTVADWWIAEPQRGCYQGSATCRVRRSCREHDPPRHQSPTKRRAMALPQDIAKIPWKFSPSLGHYVYVESKDIILRNLPEGVISTPRPDTVTPESLAHAKWDPEAYRLHAASQYDTREEWRRPRTLPGNPPMIDRNDVETGSQGEQFRVLVQANNLVQNRIQTYPPRDITDPDFLRHGVRSQGKLMETPGETEVLFSAYKRRKSPRQYFKVGKVFMVLWAEPAGGDAATLVSQRTYAQLPPGTSIGRFGEYVYSSVRRFVVIREADTYCSALPITTYHGRGVKAAHECSQPCEIATHGAGARSSCVKADSRTEGHCGAGTTG